MRLVSTILAVATLLCLCGQGQANYVQRGNYYYQNGIGYGHTYSYSYYPAGHYAGYGYAPAGYYHTYTPVYYAPYYQSYTPPAAAPPALPAVNPSWKSDIIKMAAARDENKVYLDALNALGIQPQANAAPYGMAGYQHSLSYNTYGANASTVYGYGPQALAQLLYTGNQDQANLDFARTVQALTGVVGTVAQQQGTNTKEIGSNAARVAAILAAGQATANVVSAAQPSGTTVTQTQSVVTPTAPAPAVPPVPASPLLPAAPPAKVIMPRAEEDKQVLRQQLLNRSCVQCHGENGKAGLDLRNYAALNGEQKTAVFDCVTGDPKACLMPKGANRLSVGERALLIPQ